MKRSLLFTLAFVCMVSLGCTSNIPFSGMVKGSGQVARETRPVSGFTGVDLQTVGDVTITMGEVDSVEVEADDNLLPLLKTTVIGSELVIRQPALAKISTGNPIRFTITMKRLDKTSLSGGGDIKINGLDADRVKLDLPGTGQIVANGKVKTLDVNFPGTGKIVCDGLEAETVVADHSGTGEITIRVRRSLDAHITGHGSINYYGDPTEVTRTITGHGRIIKLPQPAHESLDDL